SPVAVRWTWLSTNAGATKPPARSTTSAWANWSRPRSSLPSHTTTPSRIAMAVASGWVGLCTLPLSSRVIGRSVTPKNLWVAGNRIQGGRIDFGDVDDLTVDVVGSRRPVVRTSARDGDQGETATETADGQRAQQR